MRNPEAEDYMERQPLLHEVMHAMLGIHATSGDDWIVEGLAEFYSLELLRLSGTR